MVLQVAVITTMEVTSITNKPLSNNLVKHFRPAREVITRGSERDLSLQSLPLNHQPLLPIGETLSIDRQVVVVVKSLNLRLKLIIRLREDHKEGRCLLSPHS